jgi:Reverse transcriptase (RNA-dependent DNA polymerase)
MYSLVDQSQASFIPGRYILDNVLAAHEIIYSVKIDKSKGLLLKVDFEKGYDKVNWDFVQKNFIK